MTRVSIKETYDLSTVVNRMGIVAVKTPQMDLIAKQWAGLLQNHRHIKLVGCNIKMACASMLPADPLQVGVEAGDIAPQDMFNPILYKTVTNDSFGTLLNRIYSLQHYGVTDGSLVYDPDALPNQIQPNSNYDEDAWKIYYSLLADEHGWAKAMPQAGLQMSQVIPLVHEMASTYGTGTAGYVDTWTKSGDGSTTLAVTEQIIRGTARALPPIPTMQFKGQLVDGGSATEDKMRNSMEYSNIPNCYCAIIIMPPAKLNKLYYRIVVEWVIDMIGVRSLNEIKSLEQLRTDGNSWYHTNYAFQNTKAIAAKMGSKEVSALELINADGQKVM